MKYVCVHTIQNLNESQSQKTKMGWERLICYRFRHIQSHTATQHNKEIHWFIDFDIAVVGNHVHIGISFRAKVRYDARPCDTIRLL